jgi:hypothetical protein
MRLSRYDIKTQQLGIQNITFLCVSLVSPVETYLKLVILVSVNRCLKLYVLFFEAVLPSSCRHNILSPFEKGSKRVRKLDRI